MERGVHLEVVSKSLGNCQQQLKLRTKQHLKADSRHNLLGLDFIKSLGLLNILLNAVCNAVSRSLAQSAIMEQTNNIIKDFSTVFTNDLERCTQAETILTLKPSATLVFWPNQPEQPCALTVPINSLNLLIAVDVHSKWPEIFSMQKADTHSMRAVLKQLFSQHGLLETLVSKSGSQFTSETFQHFCSSCCITSAVHTASHIFGHSQSNGQVECFVGTIKHDQLKAKWQWTTINEILNTFLLFYWTTSNATVKKGMSPAEALMGQKLPTTLDILCPQKHKQRCIPK